MAKIEFIKNTVKEQFHCAICGKLEDVPHTHTHTGMELMTYYYAAIQQMPPIQWRLVGIE